MFRSEGWRWYVFGVAPSLYQWPPELLHLFVGIPYKPYRCWEGATPKSHDRREGLNYSDGFPFICITSVGIFKSPRNPWTLGEKKQ